MTVSVFDMTPYTQFSVRMDTGLHPDGLSLGVFMCSADFHLDEAKELMEKEGAVHPDFHCYDAVDWDRAVQLAKWILEVDERWRKRDEY